MLPGEDHPPVLAIYYLRGGTSLRLFTTIATVGTRRDITLEEVRIECFFPIDDATETICGRYNPAAAGSSTPSRCREVSERRMPQRRPGRCRRGIRP